MQEDFFKMQGGFTVITKVVEKLKTGKIKNVMPYGEDQLPAPPYIIVKTERDPVGAGTIYRIIVHMTPGQNTFLEDYTKGDIADMLDNFAAYDRHGNYNMLLTQNSYVDTIVNNDDGSISREAVYLLPSKIF